MFRRFGVSVALVAALAPAVRLYAQTAPDLEIQQHFNNARQAERGGDYEKAAAEYQAVLRARPELAEVQTNLGLVYYLQGRNEEAIGSFERALSLKPDILGANLFLGMSYVRLNEYQKSLEPLKKAISLNPGETRAYLNLSLSYAELGRDDQALEVLQRAAQLFPKDIEVLYKLGRIYAKLMTKTYENMDALDPDSARVHQLLVTTTRRDAKERQQSPNTTRRFQRVPQCLTCITRSGTSIFKQENSIKPSASFALSYRSLRRTIWQAGNWGVCI